MNKLIVVSEEALIQIITETVKTELQTGLSSLLSEPKNESQHEELLTRKETAQYLGVSLTTLTEWTKVGVVKGYRINSRVRYKRSEIEESFNDICVRFKSIQ